MNTEIDWSHFLASYLLISVIVGIILSLFLWSTYKLVRFGEVDVYINLPQPLLFCVLYYLIYAQLGPQHYQFDHPPRSWDWVQFTGAHILRAGDILDVIEEYKWNLQNVTHSSNLVAGTVMAMHWMVDVFLLGVLWQWAGSFGNQIRNFLQEVPGKTCSIFCMLLVFTLVVFWVTLAWQALSGNYSISWYAWNGLWLWPLDNLIRVIDIGDSFQLYHIRLHQVAVTWWTSSLAVAFRLLISFPVAWIINWIHVHIFKGIGDTIVGLIEKLKDNQLRDGAIEGLVRLGTSTIPVLIAALIDNDAGGRVAAAQALDKIDPQWYKTYAAKSAIPSLLAGLIDKNSGIRVAAAKVLDTIDSQWYKTSAARAAIPELIAAMSDESAYVNKAAAKVLGKIEPVAAAAIPALVAALSDKSSNVNKAATEALGKIVPVAIHMFIAGLSDKDSRVRVAAAKNLGQIGPAATAAIPALIVALTTDKKWKVRHTVAYVLGQIGSTATAAIPPLRRAALFDKSWNVRHTAANALDKIDS